MLHTHSFGVQGNVSLQSKDAVVILDDEVVRISAMFVKPRYQNEAASLEGIDLKLGDTDIVYACELPEIKGKFDPAKATTARGLKPGRKYRELQLGNSVQSDKFDKMVHPSDVRRPSIPGPIVLLVDCPTQNHMQELFSRQALSSFYESSCDQTESGKKVNCIIHLGPASVTKSFDYQSWMENFGATQHIMAGHEIRNMEIPILKGSTRISSRLNFVCPQFFPYSGFWPVKTMTDLMQQCTSLEKCESVSAQNLLKFHLRPYAQLGLDRGSIPSLFTYEDIVEELISEIPEVREVPEQVRKFWHNYVGDKNALPAVGSMLMVEEPWISQSSEKLDDSVHLQETVQREHPKNNLGQALLDEMLDSGYIPNIASYNRLLGSLHKGRDSW